MPLLRSITPALVLPLLLMACATRPTGPAPAASQVNLPRPDVAAAEVRSATVQLMERTRESARSTAEWLASGVDSWFGDKPFREGGNVTDGRLSLSLYKRQDDDFKVGLRFNARFRLPNLEEKTYLFVGRDNEREIVTDKPGALSRQDRLLGDTAGDRSFFAGIGRDINDAVDFRIGVRGGLKPYVQARYRKPWWVTDRDLLEFRETIFWTMRDHLGSTSALSYEHAFSRTLAARWVNAATITQQNRKFEWSTNLGLYKSFGAQRLFTLEALAGGQQGSGVPVGDYGLQTKWEQPVFRDWLVGEIQLGHFWPRRDPGNPRDQAWAIGTRLKMRF